ncbi:Zinc finger BED domain-containing protein 5 [Araneus ventricosus]|uniref:Zinc finger BED domain-containing protein 5 n=1 Tax=Araneus ventricosus TaxID=182803 RepID=A0A4Y2G8Q2_ARAVE|nr:Zinc finger BED domain-containing protein 5 [Araneus ventricosus]
MSIDIEATINERIKISPFFSIQVDESTDVSDLSIFLVIVRYLNANELEENLLLRYPLTKRCTGEDIFNAIQSYFCENEMDWAKCCGVCTDGGKSISGCYKGLRGHFKIVAPHVTWSHCCIHRQSLAVMPLPDSLKEVLNQYVKDVNSLRLIQLIFVWRHGHPTYYATFAHRSEMSFVRTYTHKIVCTETRSSYIF